VDACFHVTILLQSESPERSTKREHDTYTINLQLLIGWLCSSLC